MRTKGTRRSLQQGPTTKKEAEKIKKDNEQEKRNNEIKS